MAFTDDDDDDAEEEEGDDDDDSVKFKEQTVKSSFERRQEKVISSFCGSETC